MQQVLLRMEELLQLLATQGHLLPNSDEVLHSAQTVKEELSKEKPSKLTLKSVLHGIADSVKSVSTIATAVEALRVAVGALS